MTNQLLSSPVNPSLITRFRTKSGGVDFERKVADHVELTTLGFRATLSRDDLLRLADLCAALALELPGPTQRPCVGADCPNPVLDDGLRCDACRQKSADRIEAAYGDAPATRDLAVA